MNVYVTVTIGGDTTALTVEDCEATPDVVEMWLRCAAERALATYKALPDSSGD